MTGQSLVSLKLNAVSYVALVSSAPIGMVASMRAVDGSAMIVVSMIALPANDGVAAVAAQIGASVANRDKARIETLINLRVVWQLTAQAKLLCVFSSCYKDLLATF